MWGYDAPATSTSVWVVPATNVNWYPERRAVVDGRCRCWECGVERLIHRFRETWHDLLERKGPHWGWWAEFDREYWMPYLEWSDAFVRYARTLLRQPVSLAVRRRQKRRRFLQRLR